MAKKRASSVPRAWARLIRAQQVALGGVESALKREGLPPLVWYDILLELERAPGGALRHKEIEREMLLERYSVTRIVERMSRQGLVRRAPSTEDGRGAVAIITDEGKALRRRMAPVYAAAVHDLFGRHFAEEDLARLDEYLGRLI